MNKLLTIIVIGALVLGIGLYVAVSVADAGPHRFWGRDNHGPGGAGAPCIPGGTTPPGGSFEPGKPDGPGQLMVLNRVLNENMVVQTLSKLTGQSTEALQKQIQSRPLPVLITEYNVDEEAFHSAMRSRFAAMVQTLTDSGFLTGSQATEITQLAERKESRRALLNRLVEKGIKDGFLTPEEAKILTEPPRDPHITQMHGAKE